MATRGIFGFQYEGNVKAFFGTGAGIQDWLKDMIKVVQKYDVSKERMVELFNLINIDANYSENAELENLIDFVSMQRGDRANEGTIIDCFQPVLLLNDGVEGFLSENTFINDSILGLDSLVIETGIIVNLDKDCIDVFSGGPCGIFRQHPELDKCDDGSEFLNALHNISQSDNIFANKYSKYFDEFKKADMEVSDKDFRQKVRNKEIDTSSDEYKVLLAKYKLFQNGTLSKIASVSFDYIPQQKDEKPDYSIIKKESGLAREYVDIDNLCLAIHILKEEFSEEVLPPDDEDDEDDHRGLSKNDKEKMLKELKDMNISI